MNTNAMIPAILNGSLFGVEFNQDLLYLNEMEIESLINNGVNLSDSDANQFENVPDIESAISGLFALHRNSDAWNMIRDHISEIDFVTVSKDMFFTVSRDHMEVYKYLHDVNAIDDMSYLYFNLICNSIDVEFFTSLVSSATCARDILDIAFAGFNGANPYDIGLVTMDEAIHDLIFGSLQPDEDITNYVVGSSAAFDFTAPDMLKLMKEGHINEDAFPAMIKIIYNRGDAIETEYCMPELYAFIGEFHKDVIFTPCLMDNFNMLVDFYNCVSMDEHCKPFYMIGDALVVTVNCDSFCNYAYKVREEFTRAFGENGRMYLDQVSISNTLSDTFMQYVHALKTIPYIPSFEKAYIMSSAFPRGFILGFNKSTCNVFVNGVVKNVDDFLRETLEETNESGDISGVQWAFRYFDLSIDETERISNIKLYGSLNSEEEYEELARSVVDTVDRIRSYVLQGDPYKAVETIVDDEDPQYV